MTSFDTNSRNNSNRINCHVCGEGYASYKTYLDHLLDKSCEKSRNRQAIESEEVQIEAEVINGRKRVIATSEEEEENNDEDVDDPRSVQVRVRENVLLWQTHFSMFCLSREHF